MELRRHAQGAPGHAYPRTSAWNSGVQDHFYKMLEYMFLVTLQWNSGSTTHNQAQGAHINNKSAGANHSGTPHPEASWIIARESCEKFKVLTNPHGTPLLKITLARISCARFVVNSQWNSGFTDPVCKENQQFATENHHP